MYKYEHNLIKNNFVFLKRRNIHNIDVRNKDNYSLNKINTNVGQRNPKYLAIRIFNEIPAKIKNISKFSQFKDKIKEYIKQTYV